MNIASKFAESRISNNGIPVTETSDDNYVMKLIQPYAKVVSAFAKRGFDEARPNHRPPKDQSFREIAIALLPTTPHSYGDFPKNMACNIEIFRYIGEREDKP